MAFMVPQYTDERFWIMDTSNGIEVVAADLVGSNPSAEDFVDYIEGEDPSDITLITGKWWSRLTAPGYMDRTDWAGPFNAKVEAEDYIRETYDVDAETGEQMSDVARETHAQNKLFRERERQPKGVEMTFFAVSDPAYRSNNPRDNNPGPTTAAHLVGKLKF